MTTSTSRGDQAPSTATPAAMRYHANGTKPTRRTTARKGLARPRADGDEGQHEPDRDLARPGRAPRCCRAFSRSCANAAVIVGHRQKERELRRGRRDRVPSSHRADDRRARARDAGDQRQHLARADAERAHERRVLGVHDRAARGRVRSTTSMTTPPTMKRHGDDGGRLVEHALHEPREEQRRRRPPAGTRPRSSARSGARRGRAGRPGDHRGRSWRDTATSRPGSTRAGSSP